MMDIIMRKFLVVVALFFMLAGVMAQKPRPSELRKQKLNSENSEKVFGKEDADFDVSTTPDKWNNESAVIIAASMDYKYHRMNHMLVMEETVRRRVKIQDKGAIKLFSEFYFIEAQIFGLRIEKSDGTKVE
ncbi:MAG: hypothetical protein JKX73_09885, partial [Flavobacteriales bacterium]|nr:hypothetical protein [Flavobacteriales bacterium]